MTTPNAARSANNAPPTDQRIKVAYGTYDPYNPPYYFPEDTDSEGGEDWGDRLLRGDLDAEEDYPHQETEEEVMQDLLQGRFTRKRSPPPC